MVNHAHWSQVRAMARSPDNGRLGIGLLGLLASVAIHAVLIQAVVWENRGSTHSAPVHEGLGANAFGAADQAITTLFFVEDSSASATRDDSLEELASAGKILQSLRVTVLSPDRSIDSALRDSEANDESPATDEPSTGDREARAALFGRYLGQVQARVERGWLRPRTAIGDDSFECRVQVTQTRTGYVLEITLQRCNGSTRWQQSLVQAIERASPLPLPPDPSLLTGSILLSFSAQEYAQGSEPQLYEPDSPQTTAATVPLNNYLSEGR